MQSRKNSQSASSGGVARLAVFAFAVLLAGQSEARCLNRANTSLPESTPTSHFIVHPDGTLTAPRTGLMWKRCLEGQTLSGELCSGAPTNYTWADGLDAAQSASFAGHDDWRIPNAKELFSIFEDRCSAPALNADLFPISGIFGIWTATPAAVYYNNFFGGIWFISFNGFMETNSPNQEIQVLLVRDVP